MSAALVRAPVIPEIPVIPANAGIHVSLLIDDLVMANHILVNEGVLDGFGHISVRHPSHPERLLIARSMAPALVQAADIVICDLDGNVIHADGAPSSVVSYVERYIHSEIYRARPDVQSAIHSHSPAIVPFGVTGGRLRPICHMSGFLGSNTPVYDIRHSAGMSTDLLIRSQSLGRDLAKLLGDNCVALLRGHGNVVVGNSIQQSVFRAIYTESNARLQLQALQLAQLQGMPPDAVDYLTPEEAQATSDMNDQHLGRPWAMWMLKVASTTL
jgi:ribulose-5-phosphate 4-epimerase/fuculose-1-phosphate aldolase